MYQVNNICLVSLWMDSMQVDSKVEGIVGRVFDGFLPTRDEIIYLLKIPYHSLEAGFVIASANVINRAASVGKAEVHAQIGINLSPCPVNCSFCSFAVNNRVFDQKIELRIKDIIQSALNAEGAGANAIYFMTTGDFSFN